jgi:hypothetical protein
MKCVCFWLIEGDCIHKDSKDGLCGVDEYVRQKIIEASNSAEVKPVEGAQPCGEHNSQSVQFECGICNAITTNPEARFCWRCGHGLIE